MRRSIWLCALAAITLPACSSKIGSPLPLAKSERDSVAVRLDRGDWMVNQQTKTYKVMASGQANRPPEHIGFVEEREYRQARGGPNFRMFSVTKRNRSQQIGHIDQLGRAYRYEPRRNGTFDKVAIGTNSLELNVQAIFETNDDITLQAASKRRLAYEALDDNGDGVLQPAEARAFGGQIGGADSNGDGIIDFEEFAAVDPL